MSMLIERRKPTTTTMMTPPPLPVIIHTTTSPGNPLLLCVLIKNITDYAQYMSQGPGLLSIAKLSLDGQISMSFDLKKYLPDFLPSQFTQDAIEEFAVDHERWRDCPSMNVVIMIVGSRGE